MKLAVVMSIYKNDDLSCLKKSINSLLSQTFNLFTLYIMVDGYVMKEVNAYLSGLEDCRVKVFRRAVNKGLAFSLNELLAHVLSNDYEYIARMDADDISLSERFKKQIDFLNSNPRVDCVGTWAIEINQDGTDYFRKQMPVSHEDCLDLFRKRDCLIHPTVMFRKSYFDKAGLYPEDTYFGEDTMMWAKGFASGCIFANIPEYLFKFRLDNKFFERRRGWKHAKSIFQLRRRVNILLGFGLKEDLYALMYSVAKMMPTPILNLIYKTAR